MPLLRGSFDEGRHRVAVGSTGRLRGERSSAGFLDAFSRAPGVEREAFVHTMFNPVHLASTPTLRDRMMHITGAENPQEAHRVIVHWLSDTQHREFARRVFTHDLTVSGLDSTRKRFTVLNGGSYGGRNPADVMHKAAAGFRGFGLRGLFSRRASNARIEMASAILGAMEDVGFPQRGGRGEEHEEPELDGGNRGRGPNVRVSGIGHSVAVGTGNVAVHAGAGGAAAGGIGIQGHGADFAERHVEGLFAQVPRDPTEEQSRDLLNTHFDQGNDAVRLYDLARRGLKKHAGSASAEDQELIGSKRHLNGHVLGLMHAADGFVSHLMMFGLHTEPHDVEHLAGIATSSKNYSDFKDQVADLVARGSSRSASARFLENHLPKPGVVYVKRGDEMVQTSLDKISAHDVHDLYHDQGGSKPFTEKQRNALSFYVLGKLANRGDSDKAGEHMERYIHAVNNSNESVNEMFKRRKVGYSPRERRRMLHALFGRHGGVTPQQVDIAAQIARLRLGR